MQSIWKRDHLRDLPARWALGLMTPRRKLASSAYYPGPKSRLPLAGGKMPYWYVFDHGAVTARASSERAVVAGENFIGVSLMGTASQAAGFKTQFYHLIDRRTGFRFSRVGVNNGNGLGSAQDPLILRTPYRFGKFNQILNRVQNLATVDNDIQVVLYGLMD